MPGLVGGGGSTFPRCRGRSGLLSLRRVKHRHQMPDGAYCPADPSDQREIDADGCEAADIGGDEDADQYGEAGEHDQRDVCGLPVHLRWKQQVGADEEDDRACYGEDQGDDAITLHAEQRIVPH